MSALAETQMPWDILFVEEADALGEQSEETGMTSAGHKWHRHWPGKGTCAMLWIIHRTKRACCAGVRWRGRAGALTMRPRAQQAHESTSENSASGEYVTFVGMHDGLSLEALADSLSDGAFLYRTRWRPGPGVFLGDMNIDLLPTVATYPFQSQRGRDDHQRDARELFQSWCDSLNIGSRLAEQILEPAQALSRLRPYAVPSLEHRKENLRFESCPLASTTPS